MDSYRDAGACVTPSPRAAFARCRPLLLVGVGLLLVSAAVLLLAPGLWPIGSVIALVAMASCLAAPYAAFTASRTRFYLSSEAIAMVYGTSRKVVLLANVDRVVERRGSGGTSSIYVYATPGSYADSDGVLRPAIVLYDVPVSSGVRDLIIASSGANSKEPEPEPEPADRR